MRENQQGAQKPAPMTGADSARVSAFPAEPRGHFIPRIGKTHAGSRRHNAASSGRTAAGRREAADASTWRNWSRGFKPRSVCNDRGGIIVFRLAGADADGRNSEARGASVGKLYGRLSAGKGYISPRLCNFLLGGRHPSGNRHRSEH